MNLLLVVVVIVAIVLLLAGAFVETLKFLLVVGLVLAILAIILFLMRRISGRKS